jgi:hypothetical protein
MISAISNKGHLQFMLLQGSFNSEVFEDFLSRMIRYGKQKILPIRQGN